MTTETVLSVGTDRRQQAEQRLMVITNALEVADAELVRALLERDWEVFGLPSFERYCVEKLPGLTVIKLRRPARLARIKALLEADPDLPERTLAAAAGASVGTAHNDVVFLTTGKKPGALKVEQPAPPAYQSSDERYAEAVSGYRAAAALVAAQGAHGLTYVELCEQTGWRGGQATGALSKAHRKGLIAPTQNFRLGCAAYVAAS